MEVRPMPGGRCGGECPDAWNSEYGTSCESFSEVTRGGSARHDSGRHSHTSDVSLRDALEADTIARKLSPRERCRLAEVTSDAEAAYLAEWQRHGSRGSDVVADESHITAVFNWNHGGDCVYLLLNEDGVDLQLKMTRSGNSFMLIREVPRVVLQYSFLVDGVEHHSPDQPFHRTESGVRNYMDCCNVVPIERVLSMEAEDPGAASFAQSLPDPNYLSQEPPPIPNALLYRSPNFEDGDRMANDIHIMANHVYHDTRSSAVFGPKYNSYVTINRWESATSDVACTWKSVALIYVAPAPPAGPAADPLDDAVSADADAWFRVAD